MGLEPAVSRGPAVSLLCLLVGCVVAVTVDTVIEEPVDAIEVTLDVGELSVSAEPGPVSLEADLGSVGGGQLDYDVVDAVLVIEAECAGGCAGEITLTAPRPTALTAKLEAGEIEVSGLAGDLDLTVSTGSIDATDLASAYVTASVQNGELDLSFDRAPTEVTVGIDRGDIVLQVPAGAYVLDLTGDRVETDGVVHDPSAAHVLHAHARQGKVTVEAD